MKYFTLFLLVILLFLNPGFSQDQPWMNKSLPATQRANLLLEAMDLDQKFHMIHGWPGLYVGNIPPIKELSIPSLNL